MKKSFIFFVALLLAFGGAHAHGAQLKDTAAMAEQALEQAGQAYQRGDAEEAYRLCTEAIMRAPEDPNGWFYRGLYAAASGNSGSAYVDYSYTLSLAQEPMLYLFRADLMEGDGRWQELIWDCTMAISLGLETEQLLALRSKGYSMLGCYGEALADVNRGLALFPDSLSMLNARGVLHYHQGNFEEALADYQAVLEAVGEQGVLYYNIAVSLYLLNRKEEADLAARKAADLAGMTITRELARADFDALKKTAPYAPADQREKEAASLREAGLAAYYQGEEEKALAQCRQAILANPHGAEAYYLCGFLYAGMGELQNAMECFAFALSKAPENASCLSEMAQLLLRQDRGPESAIFLERAARIEPENAQIYYNYGITLYFSLQGEEALPFMDKAIALDDTVALYHGGRGDVLTSLKRYEEAISAYERCIALDPADEMAAISLAMCKVMAAQQEEEPVR